KLVNFGQAKAHVKELYGELDRLAGMAFKVGAGMTAVGVALAANLAKSSMQSYGDLQGNLKSLETITGSAKEAAAQWARLRAIAQDTAATPTGGLKLAAGIQASTKALGDQAIKGKEATDAVATWGNVVQRSGKGAAAFDLVTLALTQMASKTKLSGEELRQMMEQVPETLSLVLAAFGTTDTEQIAKMGYTGVDAFRMMTAEAEKLAKVGQTDKNRLDNIAIGIDMVKAAIGKGIMDNGAREALDGFLKGLADGEGGAERLGKALAPAVVKVIEFAEWLGKADGENLKWVVGIGASTAGLLLLVGGIGKTIVMVAELKTAYTLLAGAEAAAGAAGATLAAGPIAAVIAALAIATYSVGRTVKAYYDWRDAADEAAAAQKRLNASVSEGEQRGYLDPENRKNNTDPSLPSIVGPARPGQSIREAEIAKQRAAAAEDEKTQATVKARTNLESIEKLESARVSVLESQLDLVRAQGGGYEQQRVVMGQLVDQQRRMIESKLAADIAAADKANDPAARQTAWINADAAANKVLADRARFENDNIERVARAREEAQRAQEARNEKIYQAQRAAAQESIRAEEARQRAIEERIAAEKRAIQDQFNAADRWHRSMVGLADAQQRAAEAKGDTAGAAKAKRWADQLKGEMLMGNLANEQTASGKQAIMADFMAQKLAEETNKAKADQPSLKSGASAKLDAQRGDGQLANAVIGGDQARVADILAQAHGRGAGGENGGLLAAIRHPNTDGLQRSIASALQQRDRRQQQAMLDGLAGYR
ncbi:MAG: tape measure protein, partial [Armatimonadetes bacterium]|nr:tape measure protein [Armatimonadota bacterium]